MFWRLCGVAAVVLAWLVILLSINRNPWFDLFKHALSDLGGPRAFDPWIYNLGLLITGVIALIYALYLAYFSTGKVALYASAFVFIAGIFLALIGIFPSGTRPHTFVSSWFFVQMWMAILASSIDFLAKKKMFSGMILLSISIAGPLIALLIEWPSVALLEVYGIILIDAYIVVLTVNY
ncbi:hypothetical protein DSO06_03645 [Candidatus Nezhaarchaeota archaeon WYZ-LMO8]|nr:MAG: hypothetical protein DSO06_03645 [Candidatus Nezhaarchaeota archaeon WYZ-LMO8]TDA37105.1 MAG: hypothetical protein DSO05_01265 [Candidatus Nezhaarchaeota archaeon WYZ-LMO7]